MQQHEEDKIRDLERQMRRLKEECTTADQRRLCTEVELNSFKQQLIVEFRVFCFSQELLVQSFQFSLFDTETAYPEYHTSNNLHRSWTSKIIWLYLPEKSLKMIKMTK